MVKGSAWLPCYYGWGMVEMCLRCFAVFAPTRHRDAACKM